MPTPYIDSARDLPSEVIHFLQDMYAAVMITENTNSASGKLKSITAFINDFQNSFGSTWGYQDVTISGGIILRDRVAKWAVFAVNTEGDVSQDDLDTLSHTASATGTAQWQNYDVITVYQRYESRAVTITSNGNFTSGTSGQNIQVNGAGRFASFRYFEGTWSLSEKFPMDIATLLGTTSWAAEDAFVYVSGGLDTIDITGSWVNVYYKAGEVLASSDLEITATAGGSGGITVYTDEGIGPFAIATIAYTAPTTPAIEVVNLSAEINAGTAIHGYTAVDDGLSICTISAPVGTGASGNGYLLSAAETSGLTYAINSQFAGGANGVDADTDLELINGGAANQMLILYNAMSANTITLKATGGGNMNQTYVQIQPLSFVQLYLIGGTWKAVQIGVYDYQFWSINNGFIQPAAFATTWDGVALSSTYGVNYDDDSLTAQTVLPTSEDTGLWVSCTIPRNLIFGLSIICDVHWFGLANANTYSCELGFSFLAQDEATGGNHGVPSWNTFTLSPNGRMQIKSQTVSAPTPTIGKGGQYGIAFMREGNADANPNNLIVYFIVMRFPVWTQSI